MNKTLLIACPLCDSSHHKTLYKLNGWTLVKCLACDFVFVNPRPTIEEFERGFGRSETDQTPPDERDIFNVTESFQAYYAHGHVQETEKIQKILDTLLHHTGRDPNTCRLLDFGCGDGTFLTHALSLHMDAYGYDIGNWNQAFLQVKGLSPRVFIGPLHDTPYTAASFDIVYANAVMGHFYDPQREIAYFSKILKPGGILAVMSTPNINSLFIRLGVDSFDGNVPLTHVSFFSPDTLLRVLQQNSFQPISMKTWGVPLRLTFPPVFQTIMQHFGRKSLEKKLTYYESDCELSTEEWQDSLLQSPLSRLLKTCHMYDIVKKSCNIFLNAFDGGQVIDVIAVKKS